MRYYNMSAQQIQDQRFSSLTSLLLGLMRLVRLVRLAWRILVRARVFFMRCAWAMSGGAEQSDTRGTVRFALGPLSHRQLMVTLPVLALRRQTMRCSTTNSWARMASL